jgi:nitroreductase
MSINTVDSASAGLHQLLANRWSPREFSDRPIDSAQLRSLFEAARWAPSCFNEQPWRFVIATRTHPESFARVLSLLMEKNQQWAKDAYVIGFSAGKKTFTQSGAPDRFGLYDTGAAAASLAIEATALGLYVHFMGGFDAQRARNEFGVPEDFDIGAAFVVGHLREGAQPTPRSRKPVEEFVFEAEWGKPAAL